MTEDTSPENLRKFLESDDPAMVMMGLSMAKEAKVSESYYFIMALSLWDSDEEIREAAGELVEEVGIEKIINKEADNSTTEGILVSQFQRKKAVIPLIMALGSPVGQIRSPPPEPWERLATRGRLSRSSGCYRTTTGESAETSRMHWRRLATNVR